MKNSNKWFKVKEIPERVKKKMPRSLLEKIRWELKILSRRKINC